MDAFRERLAVRAATIDELLSDEFEALPGQKDEADLASRRLAAWCRASASGDWSLFTRRLERDGWSITRVLEKFATVRRSARAAPMAWLDDAIWIEAALQRPAEKAPPISTDEQSEPYAFEDLFTSIAEQAETLLWSGVGARARDSLNQAARACLRRLLLRKLSGLCAAPIYERFTTARKARATPDRLMPQHDSATVLYTRFVAEMQAGGFRNLFEEKPVLLRLIAVITRQWIDTSSEFVVRLSADRPAINRDILHCESVGRCATIEGELSDPHNGGRSVLIVGFENGSRAVYKPKDLRVDTAWHALVERLNRAAPPLELRAARAISRDSYGWTEFIEHTACADQDGFARFFRRAGGWLALFHCFVAADMHQENMIAAGDHPVPIDLEMILQPIAEETKSENPEAQAADAAAQIIANSVMMVGLLPAYGRSVDNTVFAMGGMTADWKSQTRLVWTNINSDAMRPAKITEVGRTNPNLPHIDGRYTRFGDHIDEFIAGFEAYATFLARVKMSPQGLFDGFAGVSVRKIIHPTRFYYMLLQRLKNHRPMDDGAIWSAEADFVARLADWEKDSEPFWPLQRSERAALTALNVPHFTVPADGHEIRDGSGILIKTETETSLDRARTRVSNFDEKDIAWQIEVIKENTNSISKSAAAPATRGELKDFQRAAAAVPPTKQVLVAEADRIAEQVSSLAIRRGPAAAWIGLDWLGDSEVFQLACLGSDFYNGVSGIALFLAAHAAATGSQASGDLALAAVSSLRKDLRSRSAARIARSLGIGAATGLGSIVYALTAMSQCLRQADLLADAQAATELFTADLIAADKQLDVMGGSAGAILALLRLYRDTRSAAVLDRAIRCGEHLTAQSRLGPEGCRSWVGQGSGSHGLNGMSHGAAGFAYALASLAAATGRDDFARAASECIAFENSSYDGKRKNWPDLRGVTGPLWPCQWCHGAPGIGLARIATARRGGLDSELLGTDIRNAVEGADEGWPAGVDTLCCGTLGSIEFFCEAGKELGRSDLTEAASRRLAAILERAQTTGDYRWNNGRWRFNVGLFRGLAGVGYTVLRRIDASLPNALIWE
jgi:type 2 lantibiotic biosynthesis protein LanM